jgi:hypothetical protein
MRVDFDTIEDFTAEISAELALDVARVDEQVIRTHLDIRNLSKTSLSIRFVAGFLSFGELRQLAIECGQDFLPSNKEASTLAATHLETIRAFCTDNKLTTRGGKFTEE